jgi:hypothetical protein
MLVKINDFDTQPREEILDATNRDLNVGDFVAYSEYNNRSFSFGRVFGFNDTKKKNVLLEACSLSDETGELTFVHWNAYPFDIDSKNLVKVNGAEKNWFFKFVGPIQDVPVMQAIVNGQPSGPWLNVYGNPV